MSEPSENVRCWYGWIPTISGDLRIDMPEDDDPFKYIVKQILRNKEIEIEKIATTNTNNITIREGDRRKIIEKIERIYDNEDRIRSIKFKHFRSDKPSHRISDKIYIFLKKFLSRRFLDRFDKRIRVELEHDFEADDRDKHLSIIASICNDSVTFIRCKCKIHLDTGIVEYKVTNIEDEEKTEKYITQIHITIRDVFHEHVFHTSDRPLPPVPINKKEKERAIEKILEKYIEKFIKYKSRFNKKPHELLHITKITKRFCGEVIYAKSFIDTVRKRYNIPEEKYNIMTERIERFEEVANALVKYKEDIYRLKGIYQRFLSISLTFVAIIIATINVLTNIQNVLISSILFTFLLTFLLPLVLTLASYYYILYTKAPNIPKIRYKLIFILELNFIYVLCINLISIY